MDCRLRLHPSAVERDSIPTVTSLARPIEYTGSR